MQKVLGPRKEIVETITIENPGVFLSNNAD
jgi:hypothetical protein